MTKKVKVKVIQICRVQREAILEIEASDDQDVFDVIEGIQDGDIDLPNHDDNLWTSHWDLQSEEVQPA